LADWKSPLSLREPISLQELERSFNTEGLPDATSKIRARKESGTSAVELMMGCPLPSPAKVFVVK